MVIGTKPKKLDHKALNGPSIKKRGDILNIYFSKGCIPKDINLPRKLSKFSGMNDQRQNSVNNHTCADHWINNQWA